MTTFNVDAILIHRVGEEQNVMKSPHVEAIDKSLRSPDKQFHVLLGKPPKC